MQKALGVCLGVLLLAVAAWAQTSGPSAFIVSKSSTDTPATANQASDEATAAAHYLEDQIAIALQKQYPCAKVTEDRDVKALLDWNRQHQLLDPNFEADLDSMARSLGAKYLILATATQSGGKEYLSAVCINTATNQAVSRQAKSTGGPATVDDAESLASSFAASLAGAFSSNFASGKTYPVGTVLKATCKFADANYKESTWTDFQWWDASRSGWNNFTPSVDGSTCTARFMTPGKYRMVLESGRWDHAEKSETAGEFTIAGTCNK